MANQNGSVYGLTLLCPIKETIHAADSHALAIRKQLAGWKNDGSSPFAIVSSTHMCRLVVMDDVVFVGHPAREEHLRTQYLIFECNFDGDLDTYLTRMATEIPESVDSIWKHCSGFPGTQDVSKFIAYMKSCQLTTTFYFADVNNKTVAETKTALATREALAEFVALNQGKSPAELKAAFGQFMANLKAGPQGYAAS